MVEETGTLERIAEGLANALTGLSEIAQPANLAVLLNELGIDSPPNLGGDAQLAQSLSDVVTRATELTPRVEELILAAEVDGTEEIVTAGAAVLAQCTAVSVALDAVGTRLQAALATTPGGPQLAAEFAKRVIGDVIARYLDAEHPLLRRVLTLATVLEWDVVTPETDGSVAVIRRRLHVERLPKLLSDPLELLESGYGWGRNDFNASRLLQRISELFEPLDPIAAFGDEDGPPVPPVLDFGAFTLAPAATTPPGLAGELFLEVAENAVLTLAQLSDEWSVVLGLGGRFREGLTVQLVPPTRLEITPPPSGTLEGRVALEVVGQAADPTHPFLLLGIAGASRMEAKSVSAGVEATGSWSLGAQRADADVGIRAIITGGRILVSPVGGDGFLTAVLPRNGMQLDFDLEVGWSSTRGLHIEGGSGLTITIPVSRPLGPILLDSVNVGGSVESSALVLTAGITARVELGPVKAVVEDFGIRLDVDFASRGNLSVANLDLGFKPPNGLGLAIDAGAVVGGGFLFFKPDQEQYAGAAHLEFEGGVSLNAIGLLTTRLPDGSEGFSLLVIVTASGFKPINLGFGFTLNGVGGLLGINRTAAVDVLRERVRNRTLDAILFSKEDPTPRAPEIVSVLRSVFPPARDRHVFGPTAVIGWGTPTVLTLEIAVVLELLAPLRLIVVGRLRALLPGPDERLARVKLNMDALGVVEFDRREASIDATLYDSSVAGFPITGDMAMRASWGERPGIALAVGGFHPRFQPPPGFPKLRRLAIALSTSDNPRLRLEAYLALTSNTVQLGARLDLYVEAGGFNLSGMMSFDALAQFAPFELELDLAGNLALKRGSRTLMGVDVRMHLTGPAPWHARGQATFRILFFSTTVRFEAGPFGAALPPPPSEAIDIWLRLREALTDARNWGAELPAEGSSLATMRALQPKSGEILVHPLGEVSVRQREVPLEREISRFANAPPTDHRRFRIELVQVGTERHPRDTESLEITYEHFAPAQFFKMSDDQKLASPGFDPMPAGARVSGDGAKSGPELAAPLEYETIVHEPGEPPADPLREKYTPVDDTLARLAETSAAGMAELRRRGRAKFAVGGEAANAVSDPEFVVVSRAGLTPVPLVGVPQADDSFSGAREALRRYVADNPSERDNVQVVRREEVLS